MDMTRSIPHRRGVSQWPLGQQPLECGQRQSRPGRCPAGDSGLNGECVRS